MNAQAAAPMNTSNVSAQSPAVSGRQQRIAAALA
jgi:hypothetical protein